MVKTEMKLVQPKGAYLNKSEFLNNLCVETGLTRKEGRTAMLAMSTIGTFELSKYAFNRS